MPRFLQIAVNVPLNQLFTYLDISDEKPEESRVGRRADLKFGNRKMTGFILDESKSLPADCPVGEEKIRPITKVLDKEPLLTPELIDLAKWISSYYLCSIGEAVSAMLPSGRRESDAGGFSFSDDISIHAEKNLSDEQLKCVQNITHHNNKSIFHYVYGPTGSGKTEVFLQTAQKILEAGKGIIYLVPEISLTPQVIEAVTQRFGKQTAVLHSGLTPSQKLSEWRRILSREARIVVGARSAVFAPVPDLGMIIIDEEHDSSYKSGSSPRYHARQVAMYRCLKNKIPLVMGSATPSVESWQNMQTGQILRHTLTKRLAGGKMPEISCVNLSHIQNINGCISPQLESEVRKTLEEKRQTILFLNRRGFTHFFRCNSCGFELKCKNCSVALTYHKNEKRLRCHYCGWSIQPPSQCPQCGSLDVGYSGFGTEYIESEVKAKFPNAKSVRIDTDSLTHKGELQEKLDAFKKGEYDIMLGTQMVAKGLNFPRLKLVGVILADTGLHLPDFRAAERTFSLITQVAGRAGRFFPDGKVIVQTYSPDREPIALAVTGQTEKFYDLELQNRKILAFPPFSRLLRVVFRAPTETQAKNAAIGAAKIFEESLKRLIEEKNQPEKIIRAAGQSEILGPSECPLSKISANYRWQILLRGPAISVLQMITSYFIDNYEKPSNVYIEYDADPVSML